MQLIRNWTQEVSNYIVDGNFNGGLTEDRSTENNCRVFHGTYLLSVTSFFQFNGINGFGDGVVCKCPGSSMFHIHVSALNTLSTKFEGGGRDLLIRPKVPGRVSFGQHQFSIYIIFAWRMFIEKPPSLNNHFSRIQEQHRKISILVIYW